MLEPIGLSWTVFVLGGKQSLFAHSVHHLRARQGVDTGTDDSTASGLLYFFLNYFSIFKQFVIIFKHLFCA